MEFVVKVKSITAGKSDTNAISFHTWHIIHLYFLCIENAAMNIGMFEHLSVRPYNNY